MPSDRDRINLLEATWPGAPDTVGSFCTLRSGGVSLAPFDDGSGSGDGGLNLGIHVGDEPLHVAENRRRLRAMLPAEPLWLNQVHGNRVIDAAGPREPAQIDADAAFSTVPGVVCAVMTADCLPVLLRDVDGRVVGVAHAGWRGLAAGVLQNTVAAMRAAGAGELMAWLGPAIGPAHFEVGAEVRAAFVGRNPRAVDAFVALPSTAILTTAAQSPLTDRPEVRPTDRPTVPNTDGPEVPNTNRPAAQYTDRPQPPLKYLADLYLLAHLVLQECGIERVSGESRSTLGEPSSFYSYRRDGRSGRMASVIWIK